MPQKADSADPTDQRASGEVQMSEEKPSMTLEEKYKFGCVGENKRNLASITPAPYSLELQRPVGESYLETMEKSKATRTSQCRYKANFKRSHNFSNN